ncbi:MAG: tRNA guanosine(34) transglycosylase Tgt [Candidatus Saccharibacteria bacterium]|nr:tRNA guanosine(34) transglycosylase Tgt [Candidatus Saccharibacteria bacterium]
MLEFRIEKKLGNGLGRAGVIRTEHGEIRTPTFMVVGTRGEVKFMSMDDLRNVSAQGMLSNGYHLRGKAEEIFQAGGLAKWNGWNGPTVTDSGGFQVMSLGSGLGKVVSMGAEATADNSSASADAVLTHRTRSTARSTPSASLNNLSAEASAGWADKDNHSASPAVLNNLATGTSAGNSNEAHAENLVKITEEGVHFTDPWTGKPDFISPEESMRIQCKIGADIHMAFDELTSIADDYDYNVSAMRRTERWAERSLVEHNKHRRDLGYDQNLYGVLQGGRWEDLRRATARKLGAMEFDGFGLGGAFLKEDLGEILRWCDEELPEEKPRHLLGLSRPDDLFIGAEMGADTFDCVAPMREARHGKIYTREGDFNLRKFMGSELALDEGCDCLTCQSGMTRGRLRELWKNPETKLEFFRLATIHNVRFIVRLCEEIRESILCGNFYEFKREFLGRYLS